MKCVTTADNRVYEFRIGCPVLFSNCDGRCCIPLEPLCCMSLSGPKNKVMSIFWRPHLLFLFINTFLYLLWQALPKQKPGKWVELTKTVSQRVQWRERWRKRIPRWCNNSPFMYHAHLDIKQESTPFYITIVFCTNLKFKGTQTYS